MSKRIFSVFQWGLWVAFAFALQFQCTPVLKGIPLRFSLSDLILPVLWLGGGLAFLRSLKTGITQRTIAMLAWFFLFTAWLGFSLWNGYQYSGSLSNWALINKFCGWFVLIAYFGIGVWFAQSSDFKKELFLKAFLICSGCISLYCLTAIFFKHNLDITFPGREAVRIVGFLENPSAYGLLCVFSIFLQYPFFKAQRLFSPRWHQIGLSLNFSAMIYSGSRTAWLAFFVGMLWVCIHYRDRFKGKDLIWLLWSLLTTVLLDIRFLLIVLLKWFLSLWKWILLYFPNLGAPNLGVPKVLQAGRYFFRTEFWIANDGGAIERVELAKRAIALWLKSPILGTGLGSFLAEQKAISFDLPVVIHSTPLWLLTETGLIGFSLLLIAVMYYVKNTHKLIQHSSENSLLVSGFPILIAFGAASLTTEILYQRHLCFLLGVLWVGIERLKGSHERNVAEFRLREA